MAVINALECSRLTCGLTYGNYMQISCMESLTDMVNTMHQLSATTTFEELQQAVTSVTDIVGNLLQVCAPYHARVPSHVHLLYTV